MNISKKIEEIRKQPENVRIRWVIICVSVSMIAIFAIWIFSMTMMFRKDAKTEAITGSSGLENQLQDIKKQSESLKDYINTPLTIDDPTSNANNVPKTEKDSMRYPEEPSSFENPYELGGEEAQEPTSYSDLQNSQ